MDNATLVAIVDDDVSTRQSLPDLVQQFGLSARAFASGQEFLASDCVCWTKCLILDFAMPGMSGPDLQQELARQGQKIPIIFITGQQDQDLRRQLLAGEQSNVYSNLSSRQHCSRRSVRRLKRAGDPNSEPQ